MNRFPSQFALPEESPGFLLWKTTNLWQKKQREALSSLGLTHVQFVLLAGIYWLEKNKEKVSQVRLSAHASTDPMMTSQVVRVLQEKKLILRVRDPIDSRAWVLSTTNRGKQLAPQAIAIVEEVDREFFSPLSREEKSLVSFLQALTDRKSHGK